MSSQVPIRADLDSLPAYVPGRNVPGAIKLASNESPEGPLPSVVDAITLAARQGNRYPDMGSWELVERLATELDVEQDQVAVGCGSVALCQQVIQAVCEPGDEVMFGWRSFEAYPIVTQVARAQPVRVPLDATHTHDLDAMLAAITPRTRIVFVCNPNNPTGTAIRRAALERFLDSVPSDVLVVLDEAYREYVTDPDVPDGLQYARTRDNVAVFRTFSKAYGLAGVRVGYGVSPRHVTAALRKVYMPFSVSRLAQAAATASLDASDELLARCRTTTAERERVHRELVTAGYDVPETQANFVWLPLGEHTDAFAEHAMANKVIVRPFAGEGVRVSIGTSEENDALLNTSRQFQVS